MTRRHLALGATLTVALTTPVLTQNLVNDLQRAQQREASTGDCKAVLPEYLRISEQGAKSNRPVAAEALLRAGKCHESIGDGQAAKVYGRVISEFKGTAEADEADRRLSALSNAVRASQQGARGAFALAPVDTNLPQRWVVSIDGKLAVSAASNGPGLFLQDLATHKTDVLVKNEGPDVVRGAVWSPDRTQVAFLWGATSASVTIRRVNVRTGVIERIGDHAFPVPGPVRLRAWTANDIVVTVGLQDVFFVPVAGGSPARVTMPGSVQYGDVLPDGSALILVGGERLIWRDRETGPDQVLTRGYQVQHPRVSHDGRLISYFSNQSGQWTMRVAQLSKAPIERSIQVIEALPGGNRQTQWIASGRLTTEGAVAADNIYGMRLDGPKPLVDRRLELLVQNSSFASQPLISPDNTRIAFHGNGGMNVMNADGSGERPLGVTGLALGWLSADELVFQTTAPTVDEEVLRAVSLRNGTVRSIGHDQPLKAGASRRVISEDTFQYLALRNELLFLRTVAGRTSFYARPAGGQEVPRPEITLALDPSEARPRDWTISPTGDRIAYVKTNAVSQVPSLYVRGIPAKDERLVGPAQNSSSVVWTADGKRLVYEASGPRGGFEFRQYNVETGESGILIDGRQTEGVFPLDSQWSFVRCALATDQSFLVCPMAVTTRQALAWEGITYDAVMKMLATGRRP